MKQHGHGSRMIAHGRQHGLDRPQDELNSGQSDSLRLLAATALAADNIACLQIDIIGCERAERE